MTALTVAQLNRPPRTLAALNRALEREGIHGYMVRKAYGYFYVTGAGCENIACSIYVSALGHQSVSGWLDDVREIVKRAREIVAERAPKKAREPEPRPVAHFTLDGRPLCQCSAPAYAERLARAFGHSIPQCEDDAARQAARFVALAAQFPDRIALVSGACKGGES